MAGCTDDGSPTGPGDIGDPESPTLSIGPAVATVALDGVSEFTVDLAAVRDFFGAQLELTYDGTRLVVEDVYVPDSSLLGRPSATLVTHHAANGLLDIGCGRLRAGGVHGVDGTGTLLAIQIRRITAGEATINLTGVVAVSESGVELYPELEIGNDEIVIH